MRTLKINLITALILMGAILYGQTGQFQYINTAYAEEGSRFDNLVNNVLSRIDRMERKGYREPLVYASYTLKQAEVVYEDKLALEAWMAVPFESSVAEDELIVEPWMTAPFQYSEPETDPLIENWMTLPFEAAEHIEVESWMTAAF